VEGLRVGEKGVDDGSVGEGGGLVGGEGVEAGVVDAVAVEAAAVDAAAVEAAAVGGVADSVAGVAVAGPDGIDDVEDSKKRKRPMLRLKLRSPTKTNATADKDVKTDATGGEGGKSDEDLKAFVSAQSSPEPAKKRQKTLETTEADIAASLETDTAAVQLSSEPPAADQRQKSLSTTTTTTTTGDGASAASLQANAVAARAVVFGLRVRK
jgi:hypothetical protein